MNSRAVEGAFEEASRTLGFEFQRSFVAHGHRFIGLVQAFGSAFGTVVVALEDQPPLESLERLKQEGYFYSLVSDAYDHFDESLFRDTLDDWGYYGSPEKRPSWYSGTSWS